MSQSEAHGDEAVGEKDCPTDVDLSRFSLHPLGLIPNDHAVATRSVSSRSRQKQVVRSLQHKV
jgi:hypothetical protein